jgi:hypothetical protein
MVDNRDGSFVLFTMVPACSNHRVMEENSAHALDANSVGGSEKTYGWSHVLPRERIKTGIAEIALGLLVFAALEVFCCFL